MTKKNTISGHFEKSVENTKNIWNEKVLQTAVRHGFIYHDGMNNPSPENETQNG